MTLKVPKAMNVPGAGSKPVNDVSAPRDLHPEPPKVLSVTERNDELRRAIVRKAFGSSEPVKGSLRVDPAHPLTATQRQTVLQAVLEFGTHRGDTFEDDDHTHAVMNGCEFTLEGGSLVVKVSR